MPEDIELWTNSYQLVSRCKSDFPPRNVSNTCTWRIHPCNDRDQSSFTCSIRSQKSKDLSFVEPKGKRFQGNFIDLPIIISIFFADILYNKSLVD